MIPFNRHWDFPLPSPSCLPSPAEFPSTFIMGVVWSSCLQPLSILEVITHCLVTQRERNSSKLIAHKKSFIKELLNFLKATRRNSSRFLITLANNHQRFGEQMSLAVFLLWTSCHSGYRRFPFIFTISIAQQAVKAFVGKTHFSTVKHTMEIWSGTYRTRHFKNKTQS